MGGTGLISIIIPVFNVMPYLAEALESVICQTYSNLEIIIIDDGSTDGCSLICDDFAKRDDRITVVHQVNRGLSNARNAGLDIMKGDAVAFLDSDDSYHPDFIKAMAEAMERTDADITVCRFTVQYAGKTIWLNRKKMEYPPVSPGLYGRDEALRALIDGAINVNVWNKLYRSGLWSDIRFPDGHNYEDIDTVFRVFDVCRSVAVLDQPLYHYLKRPGSITVTETETNVSDLHLARTHFEEYVRANTPEVFSFEQLRRVRLLTFRSMLVKYVQCSADSSGLSRSFRDSMRARIMEKGEEPGLGPMDFRIKTAYLMVRSCPGLLKIAFPAYHAVTMLFYQASGRRPITLQSTESH